MPALFTSTRIGPRSFAIRRAKSRHAPLSVPSPSSNRKRSLGSGPPSHCCTRSRRARLPHPRAHVAPLGGAAREIAAAVAALPEIAGGAPARPARQIVAEIAGHAVGRPDVELAVHDLQLDRRVLAALEDRGGEAVL